MILGNKSDLPDKTAEDKQKIQEIINQSRIPYFEVSAKTGKNVDKAIGTMARDVAKTSKSFRIIVVGGGLSGKTSLIHRFTEGIFPSQASTTTGTDMYYKMRTVLVDDVEIELQVWDTPSQQGFRYHNYTDADGIIIMFDLTEQSSFDDVKQWLELIKNYGGEKASKIIVGNKSDLKDERVVDKQKITDLIKEFQIPYFEVSAKTGRNVGEPFWYLAKHIKRTFLDDKNSQGSGVSECNLF